MDHPDGVQDYDNDGQDADNHTASTGDAGKDRSGILNDVPIKLDAGEGPFDVKESMQNMAGKTARPGVHLKEADGTLQGTPKGPVHALVHSLSYSVMSVEGQHFFCRFTLWRLCMCGHVA